MIKKKEDDPKKKVFRKTAKEIPSSSTAAHKDFRSPNAFSGSAGPEEMKHFQELVGDLTDGEITMLVDAVGINFGASTRDVERSNLESVLNETDREVFYREYRILMQARRFGKWNGIDKASMDYAMACQAYIALVNPQQLDHDFENMARKIRDEQPNKPLHPMMEQVTALAWDIAEECVDLSPPEIKEEKWQELKCIVDDFLAGKWRATVWEMNGTYVHVDKGTGFSFAIEFRDGSPYIEVADEVAREALLSAIQMLNHEQTTERFLQNCALVLPKTIGKYKLNGVGITERLR